MHKNLKGFCALGHPLSTRKFSLTYSTNKLTHMIIVSNSVSPLFQVCHKRGAHAMGGMSAFIPSRRDAEVNMVAMQQVNIRNLLNCLDNKSVIPHCIKDFSIILEVACINGAFLFLLFIFLGF